MLNNLLPARAKRGRAIAEKQNSCVATRDGQPCRRKTTERKPYCLLCLDNFPYVKSVKEMLDLRESELAKAAEDWRSIDVEKSTFCSDILTTLRRKWTSPERLAIAVDLTGRTITHYLEALRNKGLIKIYINPKGRMDDFRPTKIVSITHRGKMLATRLWEGR